MQVRGLPFYVMKGRRPRRGETLAYGHGGQGGARGGRLARHARGQHRTHIVGGDGEPEHGDQIVDHGDAEAVDRRLADADLGGMVGDGIVNHRCSRFRIASSASHRGGRAMAPAA